MKAKEIIEKYKITRNTLSNWVKRGWIEVEILPSGRYIYHDLKIQKKMNKFNNEKFISESEKIHGDKYDYSLVKYINMRSNIKIICKKHGVFEQRPDIHLNKKGCKDCLVYERGVSTFLEKVSNIHGDKYKYDISNYINRTTKIKIICKKHGEFLQRPNNHIIKEYGCPKCGDKFGIKENKWLDSLNISERQFRIGRYVVDGYDSNTKTVYEFNGDFWHGNPEVFNLDDYNNVLKKTFGELYKKTLKKEEELIKRGYNVISIWENDFNKLNFNQNI